VSSSRRGFVKGTGIGLLTFTVGGVPMLLTPREARANGADFAVLNDDEVDVLEAFGEALAPGARDAGIAHFVDRQLSVGPDDALLMIKSFNVPPPYAAFFKAGLAALDGHSRVVHGKRFAELDAAATNAVMQGLVATLGGAEPEAWDGPPAVLVYFAVRSAAVDVVYGTVEGFQRLGVPYLPHILPPETW
jgi:hypothetical protein